MSLLLCVCVVVFGCHSVVHGAGENQIVYPRPVARESGLKQPTFKTSDPIGDWASAQLLFASAPDGSSPVEFTPAEGSYTNAVTVRLQTSIPNSQIRFALAEASATPDWQIFSAPIVLTSPTTVLAQVFVDGVAVSEIVQRRFVVQPEKPIQVEVRTVAGTLTLTEGFRDGGRSEALFRHPNGGFVGPDQFAYVADSWNHRVRRVDLLTGDTITIAGSGQPGIVNGVASEARFNVPLGIFVDRSGNILVADAENNCVRKIIPGKTPVVITLAGSGIEGYADGPAATAQFNFPNDLVMDIAGNIYVTEFWNHTIRKITPAGTVVTFVGNGEPGSADGKGLQAQLNLPAGLTIDYDGNLFVTEWGNHCIRKVTPDGTVTTFAGAGKPGFYDGQGTLARFNWPDGIAVDYAGNLFVTEYGNHSVRKINRSGVVTTVAGTGSSGFADGAGAMAQFYSPGGLGMNAHGQLAVTDTGNQNIRRIRFIGTPQMVVQPQSKSVMRGEAVELRGSAVSTETLMYQWLFNGSRLVGATNALLSLPSADSSVAGEYLLVASTPSGLCVASTPAALTVVFHATPVQRDLPAAYTPGKRIKVALRANPPAGTDNYSVEDAPPSGWSIFNIGVGGQYDAVNHKVLFKGISGDTARVLTYEMVVPLTERHRGQFSGVSLIGGVTQPVGGVQTIDVVLLHPADIMPSDGRLSNQEVEAYGETWRKSALMDNEIKEAVSVPIDYLTRAGMLWKQGEFYAYDGTITTAPLFWVSGDRAISLSNMKLSLGSPDAIRQAPEGIAATGPRKIEIAVKPQGARAYAVEESVPAGAQITEISNGGEFDPQNSRIKWGPFIENQPQILSYRIEPGAVGAREFVFSGTASFDGTSVLVSGGQRIRIGDGITAIQRLSDGKIQLDLQGWAGAKCRVETSSNLTVWTPLVTIVNTDGKLTFEDPVAATEAHRFYRIVIE